MLNLSEAPDEPLFLPSEFELACSPEVREVAANFRQLLEQQVNTLPEKQVPDLLQILVDLSDDLEQLLEIAEVSHE